MMFDLRIFDPPCFDPAHEDAGYYEWLEEQAQELLGKEEEAATTPKDGAIDYTVLDDIPLEDLPF